VELPVWDSFHERRQKSNKWKESGIRHLTLFPALNIGAKKTKNDTEKEKKRIVMTLAHQALFGNIIQMRSTKQ
jgi:hypothetical protein